MKEKRYFCDWATGKSGKAFIAVFLILLLVGSAVVGSFIYYNNHDEDFEPYPERAYEYLEEIADNVIGKDGINEAAIPEDVVKYEITYENGEIIFKYSLDNNKGKDQATSASMTVTLSKNFEVLSKKSNYSSKESYITYQKRMVKQDAFFCITFISYGLCMLAYSSWILADIISARNKEKENKKNLS